MDDIIIHIDSSSQAMQRKGKGDKTWKQKQLAAKSVRRAVHVDKAVVAKVTNVQMSTANAAPLGERRPAVIVPVVVKPTKQAVLTKPSDPLLAVEIDSSKPFISSLFTANPMPTTTAATTFPTSTPAPAVFTSNSTFRDLGVLPELCAHLERQEITKPTNIQRQAIPRLISPAQDYIVRAQTGSGKTLAFLLPILNSLVPLKRDRHDGTFAIILTPTRELAQQIYSVLVGLVNFKTTEAHSHWICPGLVIGGDSKKSEKSRLRKGVTVLVSTPGRLLDHLKTTQSFNTCNLGWLVLDEADRLLELGFKDTLDEIISILDSSIHAGMRDLDRVDGWFKRRITVLCSATISTGVKDLASTVLVKPLVLSEGDSSKKDSVAIPNNLVQSYIVAPTKLRLISLIGLLIKVCKETTKDVRVMVFISCCDSVEFHHLILSELDDLLNVPIYKLHGSLPQVERKKLINSFKTGSGILVCTVCLLRSSNSRTLLRVD